MLTSSGYLTCGPTMARVQSLGIQPLDKQGQRWLRLSPVGFQRPPPSMLSVGWRWIFGGSVIGEQWICEKQGVVELLTFLPRALLTAPCPLNTTAWHWSFFGHKPLWDQNDTRGDKHYPVPLLPLPDSSEWNKDWVCAQNSASAPIFSSKVW